MRNFMVSMLVAACCFACDSSGDVILHFDRASPDLSEHVFPTDRYLGDGLLDNFSVPQLENLPFLAQLRHSGQTGYAPSVAIRMRYSDAGGDPERWVDEATLADAIRVYRHGNIAAPVELGELSVDADASSITVRPRVPFAPGRYGVVVEAGRLTTRGGDTVVASADYRALRNDGDTATNAGFEAMAAADSRISRRSDTIAYFEFTVVDQAASMVLVRSYVNGKVPADRGGRDEVLDVTAYAPAEERELAVGAGRVIADTPQTVAQHFSSLGLAGLPTAAVGRITEGAISTPNFIRDVVLDTNALTDNGTFAGRVRSVPFGPDNPLSLSESAPMKVIPYLAFYPGEAHRRPDDLPVIVAIHGVTRGKEDWHTLANAACSAGFALIAIDLYQHGARQADIALAEGDFTNKQDPALAASGVSFPDPFINPTFVARTRDRLRQSAVDQLTLIRLLKAGDGTNPTIDFDADGEPDHYGAISLLGVSLGAMLGTVLAALSPDIERAVLSSPGGSLAQIIADSPALSGDLDLLIYGTANTEDIGLLGTQSRVMTPDSFQRQLFDGVAETITGAIDPLTFGRALLSGELGGASPRVLIQLALRDPVVPNDANKRLVWAVSAGAEAPETFPLIEPALFDLDVPIAGAETPVRGISQFDGSHTFIFDWADREVTAAAQAQAIEFLTRP